MLATDRKSGIWIIPRWMDMMKVCSNQVLCYTSHIPEVIWPTDVEYGEDEEGNRTAIGNYIKDDVCTIVIAKAISS